MKNPTFRPSVRPSSGRKKIHKKPRPAPMPYSFLLCTESPNVVDWWICLDQLSARHRRVTVARVNVALRRKRKGEWTRVVNALNRPVKFNRASIIRLLIIVMESRRFQVKCVVVCDLVIVLWFDFSDRIFWIIFFINPGLFSVFFLNK